LISKTLARVNDLCIVRFCDNKRRSMICHIKREYGVSIDTEIEF
ncbi:30348_t:CDS:1, partial [Gigaspora margarita]